MRNRIKKTFRQSISSIKSDGNPAHTSDPADSHEPATSAANDAPNPSLATAPQASTHSRTTSSGVPPSRGSKRPPSASVMTAATSSPSSFSSTPNGSSAMTNISRKLSTIRTVTTTAATTTTSSERPRPSFEDELSSADGSPSAHQHPASAFSSSVNSNVSAISSVSQPRQNGSKSPNGRFKQSATTSLLEVPAERGPNSATASPRSSIEVPLRDSSLSAFGSQLAASASPTKSNILGGSRLAGMSGGRTAYQAAAYESSPIVDERHADGSGAAHGWDSTVGKAGLGKTGRVINRLVSENDALKRDLKIERLRADESRQAARLLEDKMDRLVSDYESQLLEASVTKTLLARKERQVETLQSTVELQKKRTTDAQEREQTWRGEMEKVKRESKRQVEEATSHAALMEGRYNAISSHWRDQGTTVKHAAARMGKEIEELVEARRQDDDKITVLRDLCDQQDSNIKVLWEQKEDIARKFQEYKQEQEDILRSIKTNAAAREAEQQRTLDEAHQVLDKLKWALNVKKNIEWSG